MDHLAGTDQDRPWCRRRKRNREFELKKLMQYLEITSCIRTPTMASSDFGSKKFVGCLSDLPSISYDFQIIQLTDWNGCNGF